MPSDLILSIGQRPCLELSPRAVEIRRAPRARRSSHVGWRSDLNAARISAQRSPAVPGGEMTAFVEPVVVDELGIRPL